MRTMSQPFDRRTVLKGTLSGLAGLALGRAAIAAPAATEPVATTAVTDRISVISGAGGNVVVLADRSGALLVDGGSKAGSGALRAALAKLPGGARVQTLVDTHWHPEQTGSNEAFGKAGAQIIAHEKTRQWLSVDHYVPSEDRYERALPKVAWPTKAFYTKETFEFAGEHVELGYLLEAHTAGDAYVLFRDANVLAVGDAAAPVRDPQLDWYAGGWIGGRIDSLALLLALCNADTRVIASHGGVVNRTALEAEQKTLQLVYDRMQQLMRKGMRTEDMIAADVLKDTGRSWSDPARFIHDVHKGLWAHHNTISHDIV
jgi:cyclase